MKFRSSLSLLRWTALLFLFSAAVLTALQLVRFSRVRQNYPTGQTIAGVPVGGLNRQQAGQKLLETYAVPIEVNYEGAAIQISPSLLGFGLDLESMLSAADMQRVNSSFWTAFWDFLWNRVPSVSDVPLRASFSEERTRQYLRNEIAARYDRPPTPSLPVPGSVNFQPGQPGTVLDEDRAIDLIETALESPSARVVNLSVVKTNPARPSLANLGILLQQIIDLNDYTGLTEVYLRDLQSAETLHFAYQAGEEIEPNVSFTAASTIKIPVLVSAYRRIDGVATGDTRTLLEQMIKLSDNDSTDRITQTVIDRNTGPLLVTEDMQTLGMSNSFWGGFFYLGAPLLQSFTTEANSRTDISTQPDIYNQTTAEDIGFLLDDVYQCATTGGGSLIAAFPGEITQVECQDMIALLSGNHIAVLLQAGVPDGTQFAHKHGWVQELDGLIHTMSDAGIVFSPGGNYVVTIYLYHPEQLVFNSINQMVAQLSMAMYNYFNQSIAAQ